MFSERQKNAPVESSLLCLNALCSLGKVLSPGCLRAIQEQCGSRRGLLPEGPRLQNVLPLLVRHKLKSVSLSAQSGIFLKPVGGLGWEIKVVASLFIYYDYRVVYPSHPFIGTGDALVPAKNIISILFPLSTARLWWLCSLWPSWVTETVSWPKG